MKERATLLLGAVMLAAALAACSDGDSSAKPPPTAPTTAVSDSPFCAAAKGFVGQLAKIVQAGANSDQLGPLFKELETFLRQAAETAPGDVRPQAALAADTVSEFYQALARVNFDQSRLAPADLAKIRSPEFEQATSRLAEYGRRTCGALG